MKRNESFDTSFWATSVNQEGFDSQSHPNSGHVLPGCVSLKGTRSSLSLAGVWTQVFRLSFHFFPVLPGSFHYAHKDAEKSHYLVVVWRPVNWNAPSSTIHGFVLPLELSVVPWTLYTQVLIVRTIHQEITQAPLSPGLPGLLRIGLLNQRQKAILPTNIATLGQERVGENGSWGANCTLLQHN